MSESGLVILLGGNTLFRSEPSAMTASSGERRPVRGDPDKTQCGSSGLRAAFLHRTNSCNSIRHYRIRRPLGDDLFMVAQLVQHRSAFDEDSLKWRSVAHGTWWARTWRCHLQRNCLRDLCRSELRDHGALNAEAGGAGFPCHQRIEASVAWSDRVRYGSWMLYGAAEGRAAVEGWVL